LAELLEITSTRGVAESADQDPYPLALPKPADLEQRRRWTREDWVVYGLLTLERGGVHAVRIEEMARRSGRTPGSFYGYFASRDALLGAMVDDWRRRRTAQIEWTHRQLKRQGRYTLSGVVDDFMVRIKGEWVRPDLDVAMRVWARQEPRVRPALYAIDELRLVNACAMVRAEYPQARDAAEVAVLLNWVLAGRHILFVDPANETTSRATQRALGHLLDLVAAAATSSKPPARKPAVTKAGKKRQPPS
jgi:AcrR family transcriptional regulator